MKHTFLIVNLENTFVDGQTGDKAELYDMLGKSPHMRLVYVSDRNLHTVEHVMWEHRVPSPDYIICDGGATTVDGVNLASIPFLRTLPRLATGACKGLALRRLLCYLGADANKVVVAGHGLTDLTLYQYGYRGVVVAGGEPALLKALAGAPVFCAAAAGAGGILEALRQLGH